MCVISIIIIDEQALRSKDDRSHSLGTSRQANQRSQCGDQGIEGEVG